MKILDWANKLTRRGFLAGGAATIAAVAVSGTSILADRAAPPSPLRKLSRQKIRARCSSSRATSSHTTASKTLSTPRPSPRSRTKR